DGLVTIIVSANGEEGFVDGSNGKPANGTYDAGENYIDAGEPFIDANDNGTRDANEAYVDANTNNQWDGPNGQWDANTIIWAETRIVYTGGPTVGALFSRWYDDSSGVTSVYGIPPYSSATPPGLPLDPYFKVTVNTSQTWPMYFGDQNFNVPTHSALYST